MEDADKSLKKGSHKESASKNVNSALQAISANVDASYGKFYDLMIGLRNKRPCPNFDKTCEEIENSINNMKSDYGYAEFWMTKIDESEPSHTTATYLRKMRSLNNSIQRLQNRLNSVKEEVVYETNDKDKTKSVKLRDSWMKVFVDKKTKGNKGKKAEEKFREIEINKKVKSKDEDTKGDKASKIVEENEVKK